MATINISNLEIELTKKINSTQDNRTLALLSKSLYVLKTGIVYTAPTFASLPNPSDNLGKLYFVDADGILYFSYVEKYGDQEGWIPIYQLNVSRVWTWGSNYCGKLGDGTTLSRCSPGTIAGDGTTWCQISNRNNSVAAIKTDGTLWTWGFNVCGTLGDGTTVCRSSPGTVSGGGTTWCQVSIGMCNAAAIKTDGTLWTWGCNATGILGDGTTVNRSSPGTVFNAGTTWSEVSFGQKIISAIKTDGTLWTWGYNSQGQLGDGTTTSRCSPGTVAGGGTTWCCISSGSFHTSAIKTDGTLWTWGFNCCGSLGEGTAATNRCSPGTVSGCCWCCFASGPTHTIGLRVDGTLWTWGCNGSGQLGDGTTVSRCSPGTIAGSGSWCCVFAGKFSSFAIKPDGSLWTWGCNNAGQLGDGTTVNKCSPGTIAGGGLWNSLSAGFYHVLGNKCNNCLLSWGCNSAGQLGDATTVNRCSPGTLFGSFVSTTPISAGSFHSAAICNSFVFTWGCNSSGQLGDGSTVNRSSPGSITCSVQVWTSVSSGDSHTSALGGGAIVGQIFTWGRNNVGQLGDGTTVNRCSPGTLSNGGAIWSRINRSLSDSTSAIKTDGCVWVWGNNASGQLGDGTTVNKSSPATIIGTDNSWCCVSINCTHSIGIRSDFNIWSWGNNCCGLLGDGTTVNKSSPGTIITPLSSGIWVKTSAGDGSTFGITCDGSLLTWGLNDVGQLADATTTCRCSPGNICFPPNTWCDISAPLSGKNVAAIRVDGTLWSWGCNDSGQLGDGTNNNRGFIANTFCNGTTWCQVSTGNKITFGITSETL